MKKSIYYFILVVFGSQLMSSCTLDTMPTDRYSETVVWTSPDKANLYLNGFYTYFNTYGQFGSGQMGSNGVWTEGMTYALKYAYTVPAYSTPNDYAYYPDKITPQQNSLDVWSAGYDRIRRVNEFINGLNNYSDFEGNIRNDFEAQIRFFRAYVYFQIMKRHNQIIIMDKLSSEKNNPLATTEESWKFIEDDLLYAAEYLPVTRPAKDQGRLTKGAALAFLSRVALYAKHWDVAKKAAQDCIDLTDDNGAKVYELNASYENAYKKTYMQGNKESIIDFTFMSPSVTHNIDQLFAPGGDKGNALKVTLAAPTQEFVELYDLKTGESPNWADWRGTTTKNPPYQDLEPRFQASILYNGASWKGRKVEPFVDGKDGFQNFGDFTQSNGRTVTGYFLKKYLDESMTSITGQSTTPYVEIRLAEVYLNLAEAASELNDESTANQAIKTIRSRVNLPWTNKSTTELEKAIRKERKIELAYEGHLYWDLRRWELASIELNEVRFHGLKITKSEDQFVYQYIAVDDKDRLFPELMNKTFPIPMTELQNNKAIDQLPGW